jgi:hypothetical protein
MSVFDHGGRPCLVLSANGQPDACSPAARAFQEQLNQTSPEQDAVRLAEECEQLLVQEASRQFGEVLPGAFSYRRLVEWHVEDVLVKGQPCLLVGPEKSLKTSLAIEMSISLAAGFPFLGRFNCQEQVPVALFVGEMNRETVIKKARLMYDCPGYGMDLADLAGSWWHLCERLPNLSDYRDLERLRAWLKARAIAVVFLDPLYLCLLSGLGRKIQAGNRHAVGPLLKAVADTCLDVGATPVLVDHALKHRPHRPLGLADVAWAGPAEFARQWLLTNHRKPYEPATGTSRLYLTIGGSEGHSSVWEVDVREGLLTAERDDRTWEILRLEPRGAATNQRAAAPDVAAQVLAEIDRLSAETGKAPGYEQVRRAAGLTARKMRAVVGRLVANKVIKEVTTKVQFGKGKEKPARGLARCGGDGQ